MSTSLKPTALLIDTMSIQQYVFSSNKLSINLGASHNVANYFTSVCKEILDDNFNEDTNWKSEFCKSKMKYTEEKNVHYYIGYIGGGNALLFFEEKVQAISFIKQLSFQILQTYPGLTINYGIKENFDESEYPSEITTVFDSLNKNKQTNIPFTQNLKLHIATPGDFDNQAAAVQKDFKEHRRLFSESCTNKESAGKDSIKDFLNFFMPGELIKNGYTFPLEFEEISLQEERGHLAVVHIDGNGFGMLFQKCASLEMARQLSITVDELSKKTIHQLIHNHIICKNDKNEICNIKFKDAFGYPLKNKKLPFRPIIISGDDITFVCDGKLGIYLAEKCIDIFTSDENIRKIKEINPDAKITACAGVAIVKRKFPFIKAYVLAEELCKAAKKMAKEQPSVCSAIEYHIANTGFAGTWDSIQQSYYQQGKTNLHLGPYLFTNDNSQKTIHKLKSAAKYYSKEWSKNKLATLKRVSWDTEKEQEIFLNESELQNPKHVLHNRKQYTQLETEYDSIELIDFYPNSLL